MFALTDSIAEQYTQLEPQTAEQPRVRNRYAQRFCCLCLVRATLSARRSELICSRPQQARGVVASRQHRANVRRFRQLPLNTQPPHGTPTVQLPVFCGACGGGTSAYVVDGGAVFAFCVEYGDRHNPRWYLSAEDAIELSQ